jgi:hypothetical protein
MEYSYENISFYIKDKIDFKNRSYSDSNCLRKGLKLFIEDFLMKYLKYNDIKNEAYTVFNNSLEKLFNKAWENFIFNESDFFSCADNEMPIFAKENRIKRENELNKFEEELLLPKILMEKQNERN